MIAHQTVSLRPHLWQTLPVIVPVTSTRWCKKSIVPQSVGNGTITFPSTAYDTVTTPPVPPPAPAPLPPAPECAPPAEILGKAIALGTAKAAYPLRKTLVAAIMAGALLSFGAATALTVGGGCPALAAANPGLQKILLGSIGLPFGLLMVVISGGELFTGNTCFVSTAALAGKTQWGAVMRNWVTAYAGNLIGSLLVVGLMSAAGVFGATATAPLAVAVNKTSMPVMQAFVRGVLCNWLVCMALWQATATSSLWGKFVSCLLPVSAFVSMGLEHSVANMFFIPMGMALGAPVTVGAFLMHNLLPVTLGNIVGGMLCVALAQTMVFGSATK